MRPKTYDGLPDLTQRLNNFGRWLGSRFERTGSVKDLQTAVEVSERAGKLMPERYPDLPCSLQNLGSWLNRRYKQSTSAEDLERAMRVTQQAIELTPVDHSKLSGILSSLWAALHLCSERTGLVQDLDRAIEVIQRAVDATPDDHPDFAVALNNLGRLLRRRFERIGSVDDLNSQLPSYLRSWQCNQARPFIRVHSAQRAAAIYTFQANWEEASQLLQGAITVLPKVSPRSLKQPDMQSMLASIPGLASPAAAIAFNAGVAVTDALSLLELGRGVISSSLMDIHGDVSHLKGHILF